MCLWPCNYDLTIRYFKLVLNLDSLEPWGQSLTYRSRFDFTPLAIEIIKHCEDDANLLQSFFNLFYSQFMKDVGCDIGYLLDQGPRLLKQKFYTFLTQALIHISSTRDIMDVTSPNNHRPRWTPITFMLRHMGHQMGIIFSYQASLDQYQENLKVTVFEPLLSYLTCMFNSCPATMNSFSSYLNKQRLLGIFKSHNHLHLDQNWGFDFYSSQFVKVSALKGSDSLCNCTPCLNSKVRYNNCYYTSRTPRFSPIV